MVFRLAVDNYCSLYVCATTRGPEIKGECMLVHSGGFKGGPEGAQAHPVIGPLLVTC